MAANRPVFIALCISLLLVICKYLFNGLILIQVWFRKYLLKKII